MSQRDVEWYKRFMIVAANLLNSGCSLDTNTLIVATTLADISGQTNNAPKSQLWYAMYLEIAKNMVKQGGNISDLNCHHTAATLADLAVMESVDASDSNPRKRKSERIDYESRGRYFELNAAPLAPEPVHSVIPVPNLNRERVKQEMKYPGDTDTHFVNNKGNRSRFRCESPSCQGNRYTHSTTVCGYKAKHPCDNCMELMGDKWYNHVTSECHAVKMERCRICLEKGFTNVRHTYEECNQK